MRLGLYQRLALLVVLGCRTKPVPEPHNLRLSVIDAEENDCAWIRYEMAPPTCELIAWSEHSCSEGIEMSWDDEGERALLRWGGEEGPALEVAFDQDVAAVRDLPLPPVGGLRSLGYNPDGELVALTMNHSFQRESYKGTLVVLFDGERYFVEDDLQTEGVIGLAHSYRWSDEGWTLQATAVTDDGWELALAEEILADDPRMVPVESEAAVVEPAGARAPEETVARRMKRWTPDGAGGWRSLETEYGSLAWWRAFEKVEDSELVTAVTTVPVLYHTRDRWREIPLHFAVHTEVSIAVDGPLVVITRDDATSMIFDLRTGEILSRIVSPIALELWPTG